jgi:hypothetical protein
MLENKGFCLWGGDEDSKWQVEAYDRRSFARGDRDARDARFELLMARLAERALALSRAQAPDLPALMKVASDWILVDATTCRLPDVFKDLYLDTLEQDGAAAERA